MLPDTESVTYVYDAGGSLLSFAGDKSGTHVSYLNLVHYDKFEQRTRLVLGNGIETKYAYDPASRRLDTLTSAGARAGTFQNLHYGYDKVGNILNLHNQVAVPPPTTFGGPNKQSFGYDDLYRLTTAKGEYKSAPDKVRNYTLALTYDTNHNILAKTQSDVVTVAGGSAIPQKGTSYDWQYAYAGRQPHAPTHIGNRSFTYDLNGNQTGWESDVNGTRRFIAWDEENRIAEIDDNGERNRYVYDAKGERTVKLTKQGETVYVNQYYVVRNRSVVSKHLFAGTGRVVSHLVMGTAPGNEGRGAPGNGHGSDKTPTVPETGNGNSGNVNGNNSHAGNDKEKGNNGLHLGQFKNGKENPGQGRDRRSDTANLHAQDVVKNPTLTGAMPGQGTENRSEQAGTVAKNVRSSPLVISEGDASVELGGDTSGGESVEGVTETFAAPVVNGQSEFIWYYHPDHLGSTGFVTDQNGELYEHVEYFPFGETWVQEHSNTQRTPYLYTGKELDEETGLYYYGARYYDPRTSVWVSADPVLGEYLTVDSSLAIPNKLSLYSYGRNQPVTMLDPDGRDEIYYDQKGNETKRVETTVWNKPSTWQDQKFVQGNKPGQWWPTQEEISPGSISGVVDQGVASELNNFITSQQGEANTFKKGAPAIAEVMKKSPQGADWDYKRPLRDAHGADKLYVLDGQAYRDDYIGNVAWGSIMKHKGFPLSAARAGAGVYQVQQDVRNLQIPLTINRISTNPIGGGDDPRDTRAIEHGYARTP